VCTNHSIEIECFFNWLSITAPKARRKTLKINGFTWTQCVLLTKFSPFCPYPPSAVECPILSDRLWCTRCSGTAGFDLFMSYQQKRFWKITHCISDVGVHADFQLFANWFLEKGAVWSGPPLWGRRFECPPKWSCLAILFPFLSCQWTPSSSLCIPCISANYAHCLSTIR